jgi:hypothetical protein
VFGVLKRVHEVVALRTIAVFRVGLGDFVGLMRYARFAQLLFCGDGVGVILGVRCDIVFKKNKYRASPDGCLCLVAFVSSYVLGVL